MIANVLQPLIDATEAIMVFFHDQVGLGWGFSIVALTVVIRAALLPLTFKQAHSMRALQAAAPQMKALQEKYKEDRQRLNQEMMRFYQENKINPLGSCLPILAQLPFFLALFYMLQKDLRREICASTQPCGTAAAEFLFIPDITDKATGGVLVALIVLYVGSQLASSLLNMTPNMDQMQRRLLIALPLVFVVFIINFPAGLIVYWITTNFWTIGQQWVIRRRIGPAPTLATADAGGGGKVMSTVKAGKAPPANGASAARTPPPPPRRKRKRSGRRR